MPFDTFPLQDVNCDCLGCMQEALATGTISQEEYDEYFAMLAEIERQRRAKCPGCGDTAYVSEMQPDTAHCASCGLYSHQETPDGPWLPLRQGTPMEPRARATATAKIIPVRTEAG